MQEASNAARGPHVRRRAFALFCLLVVLYLANLRELAPDDTVPARYIPFSILTRHSLHVDGYVEPHFSGYLNGMIGYGPYFVARARGHWMSAYPIVQSLIVTPLFVPAAVVVRYRGIQPDSRAMRFVALAMDKLSAAILTALGAIVFYFALLRVLPQNGATLLALVYALASPTWSVSAQALWLQNLTEFSLVLLIWALLADDGSRRAAAWIGLALALAVANKLTNALVAFPVIAWFLLRELRQPPAGKKSARARILSLFIPLSALGLFVLWYNFHYFGNILGAYTTAFATIGYSSVAAGFRGGWSAFAEGAAGQLLSPNRGLFIFVPWTILSIWGAVRLWRESPFGWERWLLSGSFFLYLVYSKLERWYGGYTFGPRYLVDILPVLVLCLVPVWRAATTVPRRAFVAVLVAIALGVQVLGAFYYPSGAWNETPVAVDVMPERVWNWHDLQILRTLRAGPAPSRLLEHLRGNHENY